MREGRWAWNASLVEEENTPKFHWAKSGSPYQEVPKTEMPQSILPSFFVLAACWPPCIMMEHTGKGLQLMKLAEFKG